MLERSAGEEGEREESLGCKSHQEVREKMKHYPLKLTVTFSLIHYFTIDFRFIKGYMTRGQAKNTDNSEYLAFVRQNYLNRLKGTLPKTVLDKTTWQTPPAVLKEVQRLTSLWNRLHTSFDFDSEHVFALVRHQRSCVSFTTVWWCGSTWEESHPRKKLR